MNKTKATEVLDSGQGDIKSQVTNLKAQVDDNSVTIEIEDLPVTDLALMQACGDHGNW